MQIATEYRGTVLSFHGTGGVLQLAMFGSPP
jgi:hypothetical protein